MHRGLRVLSHTRRCPFSSSSSAVPEVASAPATPSVSDVKLSEAATLKTPHYRKIQKHHEPKHMLQEEYPNAGEADGSAVRLYDYKKTGEIAASLTDIAERIKFVSPYERPWTRAEKTWRRDWHPTLMSTRKAWAVPLIPQHFDILNFYKYITKTHADKTSLDSIYKNIVPPVKGYAELALNSLTAITSSQHFEHTDDLVDAILASLLDDAFLSLAHSRPELTDYRVDYKAKNEAFWIRSGFSFLYDYQDIGEEELVYKKYWNNQKYTGDDRRKLGELAFVHRDRLAASLRTVNGLGALLHPREDVSSNDEFWKTKETIEEALYSPKVFNLWADDDPLWQCPGYFVQSDETHKYTSLAFKSLTGIPERVNDWVRVPSPVERDSILEECSVAQAVMSAFANLVATAHTHGFTQYNDLTSPLSTQLVLFDGFRIWFAVAQLNTLAINVDIPGFINPLHNSIRVEGPMNLIESFGDVNGTDPFNLKDLKDVRLNEKVLERILQMIFRIQ